MARVSKKTIETPAVEAPKTNRMFSIIVVLGVLLVLTVTVSGYLYYRDVYNAPERVSARETQSMLVKIGKSMLLPENETPTFATVTDKDKLANQPFFEKAENGDKVLIYTNSGKAILYRPSVEKVVDVTMVNVKPSETTPAPEAVVPSVPAPASESAPVVQLTVPTVALYNGSTKIGVTNTLEEEIKTKFPDITVTAKEKAAKSDYQGTLVIDLSGKNADLAKSLAESIGGTVGLLPLGEAVPTTDILIIMGNAK